jgi:predicted nucleic acid-binding protein
VGAQTERRGDTGPVRELLRGMTLPAAFLVFLKARFACRFVRQAGYYAVVAEFVPGETAVAHTVEAAYENGVLKLEQPLPLNVDRIEHQDIIGFTSAHVLSEVVQRLMTTKDHVSRALDISRQTGLLCGDALVAVVMQDQGLVHLASKDSDFDRVPGLTRYAPV